MTEQLKFAGTPGDHLVQALLKQDHWEPVAQDHGQMGFWIATSNDFTKAWVRWSSEVPSNMGSPVTLWLLVCDFSIVFTPTIFILCPWQTPSHSNPEHSCRHQKVGAAQPGLNISMKTVNVSLRQTFSACDNTKKPKGSNTPLGEDPCALLWITSTQQDRRAPGLHHGAQAMVVRLCRLWVWESMQLPLPGRPEGIMERARQIHPVLFMLYLTHKGNPSINSWFIPMLKMTRRMLFELWTHCSKRCPCWN